ncbi:hypothetical protein [Paraburkholderia bannensis]|uniref:hypothetical protein n=1 Tax=Paraburkholderia bannensis TaxID=765414 RepID=UPI0012EBB18B|nr:hypothetical protein [Paraburkholderia bannensis]
MKWLRFGNLRFWGSRRLRKKGQDAREGVRVLRKSGARRGEVCIEKIAQAQLARR